MLLELTSPVGGNADGMFSIGCTAQVTTHANGVSVCYVWLAVLIRRDQALKTLKSLGILIWKGRTCPWIIFSPLRRVPRGVCWEGECLYPQFSPMVDKLLTVLRSEILFLALLRGTKFILRQMRREEVERKITSAKDKSLMLSIMCYFGNRVVWEACIPQKLSLGYSSAGVEVLIQLFFTGNDHYIAWNTHLEQQVWHTEHDTQYHTLSLQFVWLFFWISIT